MNSHLNKPSPHNAFSRQLIASSATAAQINHQNALLYHACDLRLHVFADASYLCRSHAPRPIRRWRYILPRKPKRPHKNQWIHSHSRFLHDNSMRCGQRRRSRIRRPICSRAAHSFTTNNFGRHGLYAGTYHHHVRQHFRYWNRN